VLVDVHCHLDSQEFEVDRDLVIKECEIVIVNAGVDPRSNLRTLELARTHRNVVPALGFHPEFIAREEELSIALSQIRDHPGPVSEVGLDFYWVKEAEFRRKQMYFLEEVMHVAEEKGNPVILHVRGGMEELIRVIPSYSVRFAVHAFEGSPKTAERIVELGGYLSFPPVVVRDQGRRRIMREVPLDRILTETDSPYLGPGKGVRNRPCNVRLVLKTLAEEKGINEHEAEEAVFSNFKRLMNWK